MLLAENHRLEQMAIFSGDHIYQSSMSPWAS